MRAFFKRLDEELNKVNQFYSTKESEFLERGDILNKQLEILVDLKRILGDWQRKPTNGILPRSRSSSARNSDFSGQFAHLKLPKSALFIKKIEQIILCMTRKLCSFS